MEPDASGELPDDLDDALIRRIQDGEKGAWACVLDRHLDVMVAYSWRMLNDRAEAEDVAQETFLRLLRKVDDWRAGGAKLRTWLHRVATNLCIDRLRARRPMLELSDGGQDVVFDDKVDQRLDRARHVGEALARLPERQRVALVLVHYQGFTNGEAAAVLGVSVEATESLLSRGRRSLRKALAAEMSDLLGDG